MFVFAIIYSVLGWINNLASKLFGKVFNEVCDLRSSTFTERLITITKIMLYAVVFSAVATLLSNIGAAVSILVMSFFTVSLLVEMLTLLAWGIVIGAILNVIYSVFKTTKNKVKEFVVNFKKGKANVEAAEEILKEV